MQIIMKKVSIRLLVALLTFVIGVTITLLWVVPHLRTVNTPAAPKIPETVRDEGIPLPDGWKELEIKNAVTLRQPQDMKPAELVGDSFAYREAYSNQEIYIVVSYGEVLPRRHEHDRPFDACDTSASLLEEPTHHESAVEINGRKAKLRIDRRLNPEYFIANVCYPPDDKGTQLIVIASGKDNRAWKTAQQIFSSVRFMDGK